MSGYNNNSQNGGRKRKSLSPESDDPSQPGKKLRRSPRLSTSIDNNNGVSDEQYFMNLVPVNTQGKESVVKDDEGNFVLQHGIGAENNGTVEESLIDPALPGQSTPEQVPTGSAPDESDLPYSNIGQVPTNSGPANLAPTHEDPAQEDFEGDTLPVEEDSNFENESKEGDNTLLNDNPKVPDKSDEGKASPNTNETPAPVSSGIYLFDENALIRSAYMHSIGYILPNPDGTFETPTIAELNAFLSPAQPQLRARFFGINMGDRILYFRHYNQAVPTLEDLVNIVQLLVDDVEQAHPEEEERNDFLQQEGLRFNIGQMEFDSATDYALKVAGDWAEEMAMVYKNNYNLGEILWNHLAYIMIGEGQMIVRRDNPVWQAARIIARSDQDAAQNPEAVPRVFPQAQNLLPFSQPVAPIAPVDQQAGPSGTHQAPVGGNHQQNALGTIGQQDPAAPTVQQHPLVTNTVPVPTAAVPAATAPASRAPRRPRGPRGPRAAAPAAAAATPDDIAAIPDDIADAPDDTDVAPDDMAAFLDDTAAAADGVSHPIPEDEKLRQAHFIKTREKRRTRRTFKENEWARFKAMADNPGPHRLPDKDAEKARMHKVADGKRNAYKNCDELIRYAREDAFNTLRAFWNANPQYTTADVNNHLSVLGFYQELGQGIVFRDVATMEHLRDTIMALLREKPDITRAHAYNLLGWFVGQLSIKAVKEVLTDLGLP
jgi:hypothetical protein